MKQILITIFITLSTMLSGQDTVLVRAVHDGDSYKIQWKTGEIEWVRLWGCDAWEVVFPPHVTKNQPYGVQTGNFVRSVLKGQRVVIDTSVGQDDPFGRRVVKVKLDSTIYSRIDSVPGEYVNDLSTYLVLNGYAWWVDKSLQDEMELAKQTKIGAWGLPGRKVKPETWRRKH